MPSCAKCGIAAPFHELHKPPTEGGLCLKCLAAKLEAAELEVRELRVERHVAQNRATLALDWIEQAPHLPTCGLLTSIGHAVRKGCTCQRDYVLSTKV